MALSMANIVPPKAADMVIAPVVPNAIALVLVLVEENHGVVNVKLFKSNVPLVIPVVKLLLEVVKLFVTNCNPPPGASIRIPCVNVLPAELMVCVLRFENVNNPVPLKVVPEPLVQDPNIHG